MFAAYGINPYHDKHLSYAYTSYFYKKDKLKLICFLYVISYFEELMKITKKKKLVKIVISCFHKSSQKVLQNLCQ